MPEAWRIVQRQHAAHALDGEGARLYGGRWTSPGVPVVYASEHLSLAILEVLVHLVERRALERYVAYHLTFPTELIEETNRRRLPRDWRDFPPPATTQALGDRWVGSASTPILRVPSAVVVPEWNVVLNPAHPAFSRIRVQGPTPLEADPRIFVG